MKSPSLPSLRGALVLLLSIVFGSAPLQAQGPGMTILHSFAGSDNNDEGAAPVNGIIKGSDGYLYGTTNAGGDLTAGTIFRVSKEGVFEKLYAFNPYVDGLSANAILETSPGVFIGSMSTGGTDDGGTNYYGTVFLFDTTNGQRTFTTLFRFTDGRFNNNINVEGFIPNGRLLRVPDSGGKMHFYGACQQGGSGSQGTIFHMSTDGTPAGTMVVPVYSFGPGVVAETGATPFGNLIQDAQGTIYGTALGGPDGRGVIYKMISDGTAAGTTLTVLHSIVDATQPAEPFTGLVQGPDMNGKHAFYGTSLAGGSEFNGSIYRMLTDGTPAGTTLSVLYSFQANGDGNGPNTKLVLGADGNFYGGTEYTSDHSTGGGVIFRMTPGGTYTKIYTFADPTFDPNTGVKSNADGIIVSGLLQDSDGLFYGTATSGGVNSTGTVFQYDPANTPKLPPVTDFHYQLTTVGAPIKFTCSTGEGLSPHVQASTGDPADESSWHDLIESAVMQENAGGNPGAGHYAVTSLGYPFADGVHFRILSEKTGFRRAVSTVLGPFDLTVQSSFSLTAPTTDYGRMDFTAQTAAEFQVRVQYTKTPAAESSWKDLPADGGFLVEDANTPGHYTGSSYLFPDGTGFTFRAVAQRSGFAEIVLPTVDHIDLHNAVLSIFAEHLSDADPAHGVIAHAGEHLTFRYVVTNSGSLTARDLQVEAKLPIYIEDKTNTPKQFDPASLTISANGSYVAASAAGANDAKIVWAAGDLDGDTGSGAPSFTVEYTVLLRTNIRIIPPQDLSSLPPLYSVGGTTFKPAGVVTGADSGSVAVRTTVHGPLQFTIGPKPGAGSTVAPGGLFTYEATIVNMGATKVPHAIAVVEVPPLARFDETYADGSKGVIYPGKRIAPRHKQVFFANGAKSQVVIDFGVLYPGGDRQNRDAAIVDITFQAQWADPAAFPKITLSNYAAGLLLPANPRTHTNPYLTFTRVYNAAPAFPKSGLFTDFVSFLSQTGISSAVSAHDSGEVDFTLAGSTAAQPYLNLFKAVSNNASSTTQDDDGNFNNVHPGDVITLLIGISNNGDSAAEDVAVLDALPEKTTYVANSAAVLDPRGNLSARNSHLTVLPDFDGRHISFERLELQPYQSLTIQYKVRVNSGASAPAGGEILALGDSSIGSSSTTHTWALNSPPVPLLVVDRALFAQPLIRALVARPQVTSDAGATAGAMTAIYNVNPSALPITNPDDLVSYIPGAQRYYVHYKNIGNVAAHSAEIAFPLPAHTAFYRAAFVSLGGNIKGRVDPGLLPGKIMTTPNGKRIDPPSGGFLATSGIVTYALGVVPPGAEGDVMLEVICLDSAIAQNGSFIGGDVDVTIADITALPKAVQGPGRHPVSAPVYKLQPASKATLPLGTVYLPQSTPTISLTERVSSAEVLPGETFYVQLTIGNLSDDDTVGLISFTVPDHAEFVSATAGGGYINTIFPRDNPDQHVHLDAYLATNNGSVPYPDGTGQPLLRAHSAAVLTVTLKASGSAGDSIPAIDTFASAGLEGSVHPPGMPVRIVGSASAKTGQVLTGTAGATLFALSNGVGLIDLGGGNIVAQGGGNIVSQEGGNVITQDGGGIVAAGAGNAITLNNVPGFTSLSASSALSTRLSTLLADKSASVLVPGGCNIVSQGGGNLVAAGVVGLVGPSSGTLITQDGGSVISNDGGSAISHDGGSIVSKDGAGLLSPNGSNIVSQGGGNILAAGGGVVSNDGGSFTSTNGARVIGEHGSGIIGENSNGVIASPANSGASVQFGGTATFVIGGASLQPQ